MSSSNGVASLATNNDSSHVVKPDDFNHILIDTLTHVCQLSNHAAPATNELINQILQLSYANPNQVIFKLKLKKILAQLKSQLRTSSVDEHNEAQYIDKMQGQIAEFKTEFSYANELTQESNSSRVDFTDQLNQSFSELNDDVDQAENLTDIKSQVNTYLSKIQQDVKTQSDKDALASAQLAGLLATMQSQLTNLQQQTQAYSAALKQKDKQAQTDTLTGLPNRQGCDEALKKILQAQEYPTSIGILDIDHFKKINDNYGHIAGDKVLQLIAKFVQNNMSDDFFIGRWGGEEFLLIIKQHTVQAAFEKLTKLLKQIERLPIQYKDQDIPLTASIGVTELLPDTDSNDAFDKADIALYHAKENGRNQVKIG